jgi:hypothetical protein
MQSNFSRIGLARILVRVVIQLDADAGALEQRDRLIDVTGALEPGVAHEKHDRAAHFAHAVRQFAQPARPEDEFGCRLGRERFDH